MVFDSVTIILTIYCELRFTEYGKCFSTESETIYYPIQSDGFVGNAHSTYYGSEEKA